MPTDTALEQAYNKPAKTQSDVIGISRRKEAVVNIIKQDKSNFATILRELCSLDKEDEFALRHKFSQTIFDNDTHCISLVIGYIINRRNPVKFSYC